MRCHCTFARCAALSCLCIFAAANLLALPLIMHHAHHDNNGFRGRAVAAAVAPRQRPSADQTPPPPKQQQQQQQHQQPRPWTANPYDSLRWRDPWPKPPPLPAAPPPKGPFASCQEMSDALGTDHRIADWGLAEKSPASKCWWTYRKCHTSPRDKSKPRSDAAIPKPRRHVMREVTPPKGDIPAPSFFCAVPFIWGPKENFVNDNDKNHIKEEWFYERHAEIMATWGKRCAAIRFFVDPIKPEHRQSGKLPPIPDNVVVLNMTRTKPITVIGHGGKPRTVSKHIWEKVWRMWRWVAEHEAEHEWYVKVDSDTFFFPENVGRYIRRKGWSGDDRPGHYFGHKLWHNGEPGLIAGALTVYGRRTLKIMGKIYAHMPSGGDRPDATDWLQRATTEPDPNHLLLKFDGFHQRECWDRLGINEEMTTAACLRFAGIVAEDAVDAYGRTHVLVDKFWNMKHWNHNTTAEWWYWRLKPADTPDLLSCCAMQPFGMHKFIRTGSLRGLELAMYSDAPLLSVPVVQDGSCLTDHESYQWLHAVREELHAAPWDIGPTQRISQLELETRLGAPSHGRPELDVPQFIQELELEDLG